ncbi:MAG: DNA polymerase III subunit alpha [Clostridia bacterium]|nr:DNA polymerase III subunit alpha [Clostridia bacterium]
MVDFVHLHVHSVYSLLDGAIRIPDLVSKAKEFGMQAIALTDHGVMYGVMEFYKEAKKQGIKPIIGCEVYVASGSRFGRDATIGDAERGHLILLCRNNEGYKNLTKLVSLGFLEGFYYKPRVDKELLRKYSDGLIALSACLAGEIPQALVENNYEKAKELAIEYREIFGAENFFLEMQSNGIDEQVLVNQGIVRLSRELGIPLVATNDSHYLTKEDYYSHEVLLCIQTGKRMADEDRMSFSTNEFYLKSPEEMAERFKNFPEAISNTAKIAEMCNVEFEFGKLKLPEFKIAGVEGHEAYFVKKCREGLEKRYAGDLTEDKYARLDYEIDVIKKMGYVDYFLIVEDFIRYAKSNGIPVGPGRGSAAGSIVSYCLEITDIDPLRFNLLFERFLNPERVSMPDIDIDFCYQRREEVIEYVKRKYGEDHVAQIITFGTLAARAVIRDVGRVLDVSYAKTDLVAKAIPFELNITIEKALKMNPDLREMYETDEEVKNLIDISKSLEAMPRHASTHAAGVVITKDPVMDYVALYKADDNITTQFTMTTLEELGLLKMDFLGLRTLTVIRDALVYIKQNYGVDIVFDQKMDDPAVYKLISEGKTEGVFQLESAGMKEFLKELKPKTIEDIIAGISLYRPGPMDQIPRYVKNKNNPSEVTYLHPALEPILNVTYGCMIYQEQVMQIVRELAGYSLGHADLVRRAMAKKKADVMAKERQVFIDGCLERGIEEKVSNAIFDEMTDFAKYAFNKSHAAAYAVVAYRTAFLKAHYPAEFMAAMLNSFIGSLNKVPQYINECKKLGISVLKPSINESRELFTVNDGAIRFGLAAVKNVGEAVVETIVRERDTNGKFTDFEDFCKRITGKGVNKKCVESFIKCGAFDEFQKRSVLLASFEKIMDGIDKMQKSSIAGQINFFETTVSQSESFSFVYPEIPELSKKELLGFEKEMLGLYISGHPLDKYEGVLARVTNLSSLDLSADEESGQEGKPLSDNMDVCVGGIIVGRKNKITKNNEMMSFLTLEDFYGTLEVIVFPKTYQKIASVLQEDVPILLKGRLSLREDEEPKIICQSAELLEIGAERIYLKITLAMEEKVQSVISLLQKSKGTTRVCFYYEREKVTKVAPESLSVRVTEELVEALENLLGEGCVKLV